MVGEIESNNQSLSQIDEEHLVGAYELFLLIVPMACCMMG